MLDKAYSELCDLLMSQKHLAVIKSNSIGPPTPKGSMKPFAKRFKITFENIAVFEFSSIGSVPLEVRVQSGGLPDYVDTKNMKLRETMYSIMEYARKEKENQEKSKELATIQNLIGILSEKQ